MDNTQHPARPPASGASASEALAQRGPADEPISIRSAEDILAYLPHALGEWPQESLVAVCLDDAQLGPTLRIDLPERRDAAALRRFAETVAGYVVLGRPVGVVLAVYTHREWGDPGQPPHRDVVEAVKERLADEDLPVLDVWVVGEEHWRTMTCTDLSCCPWPGATVESLRGSRIEAEMVYRGSSYAPREIPAPAVLAPAVPPPAAVAAAVEACLEDPDRWWDPWAFTAALAAWDDALSDPAVSDSARLRLLAATIMRPALRDAVLVAAAAGAGPAWRGSAATADLRQEAAQGPPEDHAPGLPGGLAPATVAAAARSWGHVSTDGPDGAAARGGEGDVREWTGGAAGAPAAEHASAFEFGLVLMGATGRAPAWDRIARLERVALQIAQMEEPEVRAPALSMLAWIHWARGRGGRCLGFLERALSADPDYRLARLLHDFVQHGQLPGWALSRETAWRRAAEAA